MQEKVTSRFRRRRKLAVATDALDGGVFIQIRIKQPRGKDFFMMCGCCPVEGFRICANQSFFYSVYLFAKY